LKQAGQKKAASSRGVKQASAMDEGDDALIEEADDDDDEEGEEEGDEKTVDVAEPDYEDGTFFGFIDESGQVVYMNLDADDDPSTAANAAAVLPIEGTAAVALDSQISEGQINLEITQASSSLATASISSIPSLTAAPAPSIKPAAVAVAVAASSSSSKAAATAAIAAASMSMGIFEGRHDPHPRIHPCLLMKGNTLYVYGGITELGDVEVSLDDCWALDLNRRDTWKQVLPGTMSQTLSRWKGEVLDDETDGTRSDGPDDDDDEEDEDGSSDDDESEDEEDEDRKTTPKSSSKATSKAKASGSQGGKGGTSHGSGHGHGNGMRQEIERLRDEYNITETSITPTNGESLRDFYRYVGYSHCARLNILIDSLWMIVEPQIIGHKKQYDDGERKMLLVKLIAIRYAYHHHKTISLNHRLMCYHHHRLE
jgi:hypothetical protein